MTLEYINTLIELLDSGEITVSGASAQYWYDTDQIGEE